MTGIHRLPPTASQTVAESPAAAPTSSGLRQRGGDFPTLAHALDYAAGGATGLSFHDGRGTLEHILSYADLAVRARMMARQLAGLGLGRGARVALMAETRPEFVIALLACQFAGLVAIPLPVTVHMGGREAFVATLERLLVGTRANVCLASDAYLPFVREATQRLQLVFAGTYQQCNDLSQASSTPEPTRSHEIAYVQLTSGSTRAPRGTVMTAGALMANVSTMLRHGLRINTEDRFCSWLPLYHDMGLVGMLMLPLAAQVSVDHIDSRAFAMRPRLWPALIHRQRATIAYGPPFGYELAARRLRPGEAQQWDLSCWRVAGVGAEMIRPETLDCFASAFAPARFSRQALLPCYGMAEVGLGISFSTLQRPFVVDSVNREDCAEPDGEARPETGPRSRAFTGCGRVLPGYVVEIRDAAGKPLPTRRVGRVFVRGPSLMREYLDDEAATAAVLTADGWLDTGDLGYLIAAGTPGANADGPLSDPELVITGRAKDLIIVNGRNIWPQDLELIAEEHGARSGTAAAFSVDDVSSERIVLAIESRSQSEADSTNLARRIGTAVRAELGVDCEVLTVEARSLPRTSSGKLSRHRARERYLEQLRAAR